MSSLPPHSKAGSKKLYTVGKWRDGVTDYIVVKNDQGQELWDLLTNYDMRKTRFISNVHVYSTAVHMSQNTKKTKAKS